MASLRNSAERIVESWRFLAAHFEAENSSVNGQLFGSVALLVAGMCAATLLPTVGITLMGPTEFGRLEFVTSLAILVALVAPLGMDSYVLRKLPHHLAANRVQAMRRLLVFGVVTSAVVALGVAVLTSTVAKGAADDDMAFLQLGLMPLAATAFFLSFCVQATRSRLFGATMRNTLVPNTMMIAWLAILSQIGGPVLADKAISSTFLFYLLAIAAAAWLLSKRFVPGPVGPDSETGEPYRDVLKSSFPMLVFSSSFLIVNQTDIIMIGYFLPSSEVSSFAFAARLAALPSIGLLAVNIILPPMISVFSERDRRADMQTSLIAFGSFSGAVYILCTLLVVPMSFVLAGWAGLTDGKWVACMGILLLGQAFNVFTGSCGYLLTMSGHQNIAARSTAAAAIANVILNLALLPLFGIVGVAVATALSVAISNLYMAHKAKVMTGVHPSFLLALRLSNN